MKSDRKDKKEMSYLCMKGGSGMLLLELLCHLVRTHVLMVVQLVQMAVGPIWVLKSVLYCVQLEIVEGIRCVLEPRHQTQGHGTKEEEGRRELCGEEVYYGKYLPQSIHRKFLRDELVLVMTDIVKSTVLWNLSPDAMYRTIEMHDSIARRLCRAHGGYEIRNEGDSFFLIFVDVEGAVSFSVEFRKEIKRISRSSSGARIFRFRGCREPESLPIELRIAINKGPVMLRCDEFFGVHGDVVTNTYEMLEHSHSNSICIFSELQGHAAKFGKSVPFCIHK